MIRNIHLHGSLADKFGKEPIELDVDSPTMVIRGLKTLIRGFESEFRKYENFNFVRADAEGNALAVTEETWEMSLGKATDIHILPAVEGSGVEIAAYIGLTGMAMYAVGFAINIAIAYALSAISQSMAPTLDTAGGSAPADQRPSFLFNGPINISSPGYPVPLIYGEFKTGSVVISVGASSEEVTT